MSDKQAKWQQRYLAAEANAPQAAQVLQQNAFLLPKLGRALDMACGRGGNALLLAAHGLETHAWDFAPAAIEALQQQAATQNLTIQGEVRDVLAEPPPPASFDVISVSYYLERALAPALSAALRPGGLLFYETFSRDAVSDGGPSNPAFRLAPNELLQLFGDLRVISYRELSTLGDTREGERDVAMLVAQKSVPDRDAK